MKKIASKLIFVFMTALTLVLAFSSPSRAEENKTGTYSLDVKTLAKNIFASCELFEEGKKLYENQDIAGARLKFTEALSLDPGNKKASKYLKLCGSALEASLSQKNLIADENENEQDIKLLERLIERVEELESPAKTEITVQSGKKAAGIKSSKEKPSAEFKKRAALLKSSRTKEAYQLADKQKIERAEDLLSEGNKYYETMNYDKAYKLYKESLENLQS